MKLRDHPVWFAWLAHRLSGIGLALFLPLHFLLLATALQGEAALNRALALTHNPLVRLAEWGLVLLLTLHLGLGLRVLALEFLPWRGLRAGWIVGVTGLALASGFLFFVRLLS